MINDDDEIRRYRLDPNKPRQLTPEEQERLDKAGIDYSDIPPLRDEFFLRAERPYVMLNPLSPSKIEWLKRQSLRVAAVFQECEAMTTKCTWEGCTTTSEGMTPFDGWAWFMDWPRIKDGWYCPAHAPLLNHLVEQAQTEGTAPPPDAGYGPETIEILRDLDPPIQRSSVEIGGIDWSQCPDVESVPGRCSGAWVAKDSRVMVEGILDNAYAGCTPAEIADMFELPSDTVRRILEFAGPYPPPLMWGEGEPTALLLVMVLHHCSTAQQGELDSHGIAANAEAMLMLSECAYIEITHHAGHHITAKVLPDGWTLIESLRAEQQQRPTARQPLQ